MQTTAGRLVRLGFADGVRAEGLLAGLGGDEDLAVRLARAADPDLALHGLVRLAERVPGAIADLADEVIAVLGVSTAFADHLVARPEDRHAGTAPLDPADLRGTYRRRLLELAGRDLTGRVMLAEVAAELSDLAAEALEAALPDDGRLAVIGMGKCGGRELNYVSDVDVVFVAERDEDLPGATRAAQALIRECAPLWQVDAALRPEGKAGPLVRTLDSHLAYYRRWAKTWEFQALLKARPVAGDRKLGDAYVQAVQEMVWEGAWREPGSVHGGPGSVHGGHFVEDVQAMRRRVEANIRKESPDRELKLGPGGLRDIEFAVQLLQLVHGRTDTLLRRRGTLPALAALARGGYVGRDDAKALAEAYTFLRRVEHLLQLHQLRRTHTLPSDERSLRRVGRAMGHVRDPVGEFEQTWRRHAREVRRLHEKLFYRPLLQAVARLPGDQAGGRQQSLSTAAASARLEALGYTDPQSALRHIRALTAGVSRRAAIQRTLLPVLLGWFADGPDPDAGLLGFRKVSDALGATPWYLRLLRDDAGVAERMARVLSSSRYATELLLRAPDGVPLLGDDAALAAPVTGEEFGAAVRRHERPEDASAALRALRRKALFRTACADLLGRRDVEAVGEVLTSLNTATIEGALAVASRGPGIRLAVIAMGRIGGFESGYGSDADVMFVYDGDPERARGVAEELQRLLALPGPEPPLLVDAALRPEGKSGPLVRTLASYEAYYRRWSSPWEAQALLRAHPIAGDAGLGEEFIGVVDPVRYGGIGESEIFEIRRLKARMEAERLPRGADPALHTKLGPGGLSDVEWSAQLLQLRHAQAVPALRTTRTLAALRAAAAEGLIAPADSEILIEAWRLASRVRNAIMLVSGRAADLIPADVRLRARVARVLGYPAGATEDLVDDYRRAARRARAVVERIFYDPYPPSP